MNDLQAIINAFEESQQRGEITFLATIVNSQGSTYRRRGARMLMTDTGRMVGMVSGGCLENDLWEQTRQKLIAAEPIVIKYDTSADEDIVWGFGLGCNGMVQVLLEKLNTDDTENSLTFIGQCFSRQQGGVLATVFEVEGEIPLTIGDRIFLDAQGKITSKLADSPLALTLLTDAQKALQINQSAVHTYLFPSGRIAVFLEVIQPPTSLIIFGAGRDAVPLKQFAKALDWKVTVVDCRASEVTQERFFGADHLILTRRDILPQQVQVDSRTVAVVMTHNYLDDLAILKMLLPSQSRYIGILGAKSRTERLLEDLQREGVANKTLLHTPIGLDIGAETPEEIAIAILAEIQAVLGNRCGGFLKNRQAAIHTTNDQ